MGANIKHVGDHYELIIDGKFHSSHDTVYDAAEEYEDYKERKDQNGTQFSGTDG